MAEQETTIETGSVGSVEMVVTDEMTASRFARAAGETFPEVLATPFMIGEMERACATLLVPLLQEELLSVGVKVEISHVAPTPVGGTVKSHGRFTGKEGSLFWFDVWSEDEGGIIGKGRHARAIAKAGDIMARAAGRAAKG